MVILQLLKLFRIGSNIDQVMRWKSWSIKCRKRPWTVMEIPRVTTAVPQESITSNTQVLNCLRLVSVSLQRSWCTHRWQSAIIRDAGTSVSGTSAAAESSSVRHRWAAITTTLRQAQTPARTVPGSWFWFLSHLALFSFLFFLWGRGGGGEGFVSAPLFFLFCNGCFAPCFWYLGLFFPSYLRAGFGLCFAFFAPLFSVVASANYDGCFS